MSSSARQWIYSKEGFSGHNDPTWIGIGFAVSDAGLLLLLRRIGVAYWWLRVGKPVAGRIVAALSSLYLVLLADRLARDVRQVEAAPNKSFTAAGGESSQTGNRFTAQ